MYGSWFPLEVLALTGTVTGEGGLVTGFPARVGGGVYSLEVVLLMSSYLAPLPMH